MEQLQQIYRWSDDATLFYACRKLSGLAAIWFENLPALQANSWSSVKQRLIVTFPTKINYAQLIKDMIGRKRKTDETLLQYFFSKLSLLQQCEISGEKAVSLIIDGLDDQFLKRTAEAAKHSTPESLLAFLKNCHERASVDFKPPHKKIKYGDRRQKVDSRKCFLCKKTGHRASKCRLGKRSVICNFCKKTGHEEKFCFQKQRTNERDGENNKGKRVL